MSSILEEIVNEYRATIDLIKDIRTGYCFTRELVNDVKDRSQLILAGESDSVNNIALLLQLAEYQFALNDQRTGNIDDPCTVGILLYGRIHKKDHELLDGMYKHLGKKTPTSEVSQEL